MQIKNGVGNTIGKSKKWAVREILKFVANCFVYIATITTCYFKWNWKC